MAKIRVCLLFLLIFLSNVSSGSPTNRKTLGRWQEGSFYAYHKGQYIMELLTVAKRKVEAGESLSGRESEMWSLVKDQMLMLVLADSPDAIKFYAQNTSSVNVPAIRPTALSHTAQATICPAVCFYVVAEKDSFGYCILTSTLLKDSHSSLSAMMQSKWSNVTALSITSNNAILDEGCRKRDLKQFNTCKKMKGYLLRKRCFSRLRKSHWKEMKPADKSMLILQMREASEKRRLLPGEFEKRKKQCRQKALFKRRACFSKLYRDQHFSNLLSFRRRFGKKGSKNFLAEFEELSVPELESLKLNMKRQKKLLSKLNMMSIGKTQKITMKKNSRRWKLRNRLRKYRNKLKRCKWLRKNVKRSVQSIVSEAIFALQSGHKGARQVAKQALVIAKIALRDVNNSKPPKANLKAKIDQKKMELRKLKKALRIGQGTLKNLDKRTRKRMKKILRAANEVLKKREKKARRKLIRALRKLKKFLRYKNDLRVIDKAIQIAKDAPKMKEVSKEELRDKRLLWKLKNSKLEWNRRTEKNLRQALSRLRKKKGKKNRRAINQLRSFISANKKLQKKKDKAERLKRKSLLRRKKKNKNRQMRKPMKPVKAKFEGQKKKPERQTRKAQRQVGLREGRIKRKAGRSASRKAEKGKRKMSSRGSKEEREKKMKAQRRAWMRAQKLKRDAQRRAMEKERQRKREKTKRRKREAQRRAWQMLQRRKRAARNRKKNGMRRGKRNRSRKRKSKRGRRKMRRSARWVRTTLPKHTFMDWLPSWTKTMPVSLKPVIRSSLTPVIYVNLFDGKYLRFG